MKDPDMLCDEKAMVFPPPGRVILGPVHVCSVEEREGGGREGGRMRVCLFVCDLIHCHYFLMPIDDTLKKCDF